MGKYLEILNHIVDTEEIIVVEADKTYGTSMKGDFLIELYIRDGRLVTLYYKDSNIRDNDYIKLRDALLDDK